MRVLDTYVLTRILQVRLVLTGLRKSIFWKAKLTFVNLGNFQAEQVDMGIAKVRKLTSRKPKLSRLNEICRILVTEVDILQSQVNLPKLRKLTGNLTGCFS